MNILLVFCHPAPASFQRTILEALVERLERDGHGLRLIDLYAERFDPVLDLEGWRAHLEGREHPGVEAHVAALRDAEGVILVYPTWWYGLPAMLKGWLDRVWQPGVAFGMKDGVFQTRFLTRIRRFAVITTCGSPGWFIERIVGDPVRRQLIRGLARQFSPKVRTLWRAIYSVDTRSREDLTRARERAITDVERLFRS